MPYHVDELRRDEPFPVSPETNEYAALRFLVANHEYGFTPAEIAAETEIAEASASKTMSRLHEKGLVSRSQGAYYVDPERVESLKHRLESLDAAADLFDDAPDDAYADAGWEDELPELDPSADDDSGDSDSNDGDPIDAETLVADSDPEPGG